MKAVVAFGFSLLCIAPALAASDDFDRATLGKKWVVVDNTQSYPIFGWLDAKWIPWNTIPVGGTEADSSSQRMTKKKQPAKKKRPVRK